MHDLRRCSGSGVVGTGGVGKPEGAGSRMGTDPWRKSKKRAMAFFSRDVGHSWVRKSEGQNLPACQRSQDPCLHGVLRGFPGPVARHAGRRGRLRLQGPDLQRSGREDEEAVS